MQRHIRRARAIFAVLLVFGAIASRAEAAAPPIMLLPGQLDISATGAATYTVPITVPPGTAGMVPSVSLEYSSQSGDGIMGLGWSLSGLPSIGRCARTVAQDTVKGSVNYDANDKFCMEGQRLIAISGTYGANGTEYRTEIEGFSRVISYGTAGTGPAYFKVWTKAGQIIELGNSTDSRILAQGIATARSWAVNKISDTKGNYLTVTYTNDTTNGQAYPTQIDYTGNAGASLTPYNSVRFTYNTSRPDQVALYHAGSLQKTTVLLTNVKTYAGASVVRDYRITYELGTSLRRSRITQIQLCDGSSNCLAPTTFGWQGTRDTVALSEDASYAYVGPLPVVWADWTGDGILDVLGIDTDYCPATSTVEVVGIGSAAMTLVDAPGTTENLCLSNIDSSHVAVGDFNGDGFPDFKVYADSSHTNFYFSTRNNSFLKADNVAPTPWPSFANTYLGDFDGDGRTDFLQKSGSNGITWYSSANGCTTAGSCTGAFTADAGQTGFGGTIVSTADFDGNGCSDTLQQGSVNKINYWCNPAASTLAVTNWTGNSYALAIGDFNGDGMADILAVRKSAAGTLQLSTGKGLVTSSFSVPTDWGKYTILTGDWNGDGKTDIALFALGGSGNYGATTSHKVFLSTGDGFVQAATIANCTNGDVQADSADFNNDGVPDLYLQSATGGCKRRETFTYTPELLSTVTNGLGITTTITYDRLNKNGTLYSKDTTATYPTVDIDGPMYVVSRIDSGNGIGGTYSSTYAYAGLKADQSGRGFLGFRQRSITDLQTNIVETTTFRQDYPYVGLIASQTKVRGAVTLNSKTNTFAATSLGGTRYFVALSQTVDTSNDLNGAAMPTVTTAYQYDAFGNETQVSVTTPDGASKVTTNTYTNDTTNWLLGRLTNATQTNTVGSDTGTRTSSFAYDATSGLLTQEVIEPGNSALRLQTDYGYDAFGNKTSLALSGVDIASRSSTATFDTKGQFQTAASNALGQSISQQYDVRNGQITSSTDLNGLTATAALDAFGRSTLTISPDGKRATTSYAYCSGVNGGTASCVSGAAFLVTATPFASDGVTQIGPQVRTYFDALVRAIAVDTQGFDGSAIRTSTQYDSYGRVSKVSRPYFVSGGTAKWTVNTYDALGRVIDTLQPNGAHLTQTFNGLTTSKTNDLGQVTTTLRNQQGVAVSVTDPAGKVVTYTYDAFDNPKTITDSAGNVSTFTYDVRGRKIAGNDPDMGLWQYGYDVASELVSQTDAKSQTVTLSYDKLGRITQRVESGLTSSWTYDTATKGIGKLASDSASNGAGHTFAYDTLSRPISVSTTIDGNTYSESTTYDAYSRVDTVTYPSGFAVKNVYTALSYLSQIKDNATSSVLWTANTANAELQITQQTAGNGVVTNSAFDATTGLPQTIQAGAGNSIANFSYTFDHVGNLTARSDATQSLTEAFQYDSLNRLTQYAITGGSTKTVSYDDLGNITSKSDVGSYSYPTAGSARPHAVASITGTVNTIFTYDANGNMIAGQGRTVSYTSFNMAASISEGTATVGLVYDANHSRIKQTAPEGTTVYVAGNVERFAATSGLVQWNEYLVAGKALIGVHFTRSDSTVNTRYFITDHLGSVAILTDETGAVVERLSYDAWGKRRYPNGSDDPTGSITSQTTKGFTGQEHIPDVGLINLNARIYDPLIGRFMAVDPMVEDIYLGQILNRYSYVGNNPLSLTDPTGMCFLGCFWKQSWFRPLVAIAAAAFLQFELLPAIEGTTFAALLDSGSTLLAVNAGIAGAVSGYINTGTLKGALIGAAQALAFKGVGSSGLGDGSLASVAAHGLVGGLVSVAQGGKFASGFLAAGFAELASPLVPKDYVSGTVISGVVGGVGSVLGGGKFWNGAETGAFGYLFNSILDPTKPMTTYLRVEEWKEDQGLGDAGDYVFGAALLFTGVGEVELGADVFLETSALRFSQRTIGSDWEEIAASMREVGWQGDAIDVVRMPDGLLTSLDNTRVFAADQAGIDVLARIHDFSDPIGAVAGRFTNAYGVPATWGDAVTYRIMNQGAGFRNTYPMGSPFTGVR